MPSNKSPEHWVNCAFHDKISSKCKILSARPLFHGWERCFNYPDNLLSGCGETAVVRWPYAQHLDLIVQLYISGGGGHEEMGEEDECWQKL